MKTFACFAMFVTLCSCSDDYYRNRQPIQYLEPAFVSDTSAYDQLYYEAAYYDPTTTYSTDSSSAYSGTSGQVSVTLPYQCRNPNYDGPFTKCMDPEWQSSSDGGTGRTMSQ